MRVLHLSKLRLFLVIIQGLDGLQALARRESGLDLPLAEADVLSALTDARTAEVELKARELALGITDGNIESWLELDVDDLIADRGALEQFDARLQDLIARLDAGEQGIDLYLHLTARSVLDLDEGVDVSDGFGSIESEN